MRASGMEQLGAVLGWWTRTRGQVNDCSLESLHTICLPSGPCHCTTLHGRVHSNECWPEGSKATYNACHTLHCRAAAPNACPRGRWQCIMPAAHCTVGFAATNAGQGGRRQHITPAPHCTVGFTVTNAIGWRAGSHFLSHERK